MVASPRQGTGLGQTGGYLLAGPENAGYSLDEAISSPDYFSSTSSTGGESPKTTRDPDLRDSSSEAPPFSLPSSPVSITTTSTSSVLFHEGLTRLGSFVDLTRLHQENVPVTYSSRFDSFRSYHDNHREESTFFARDWPSVRDEQDEYPEYLCAARTASPGLTPSTVAVTIPSDSPLTFYSEPSPVTPRAWDCISPLYRTSFFDPSLSSAGASPRTPSYSRQSLERMAVRQLATPEPEPEPIQPATAWSAAAAAASQQPTMKSTQLRPQSAPKTTTSRSASPLVFWNRRGGTSSGGHQRLHDGREEFDEHWPRVETAKGHEESSRHDGDRMLVDTVSNHLGRLTPPSPSDSIGTSSSNSIKKDRDLRISPPEAVKINCNASLSQGPPPMITKAEYEALPLAIQRKYFSTLERLRFAQESDEVDRIFDHYESQNTTSLQQLHRKHRPALSSPETLSAILPNSRKQVRDSLSTALSDDSWVVSYPDKISKADLTREEQVRLIKHLRASVILDAAGETISKRLYRPHDRSLSPTPDIEYSSGTLSTRRDSLDSMSSAMMGSEATQSRDATRESLYDSFRWLDEEENLDLSLFLDDYHANLRDEVPQTSKSRRPSFRRHLSVSKLPFSRPSESSNRPDMEETKIASPVPSPTASQHPGTAHRRLSRTLSVIKPNRHAHPESVPVIDPAATHYQDPEARQKLRAYLASEQLFDEAIQFGFPANDSLQSPALVDPKPSKHQPRSRLNGDDEHMRSFLDFDGDDDDNQSDRDDRSSLSDPDSPLTPHIGGGLTPPPGHFRPSRVNTDPLNQRTNAVPQRQAAAPTKPRSRDSYAHHNGPSREMTLRMTLTRPDLRADDELIYGWQSQTAHSTAGRKSTGVLPRDSVLRDSMPKEEAPLLKGQTTTACWSESKANKEAIERMLAEMDLDGAENAISDHGVMKRIWNKVRRA